MDDLAAATSTQAEPGSTGSTSYKAFISYSHAVNGRLAPALQLGLHQFAKPWYRLRAIRVFRDEASLSANPALWSSIRTALESSEFFILLASPEAAGSRWVAQEVNYWLGHKPLAHVLIVLTGGECVWDEESGRVDRERTTALPPALAAALEVEPRFIDLRWAQEAEDVSLRNAHFRDRVADLAAPLNGRPKDELNGEDVRQHRRTVRVARAAVALLLTLTAAAVALAAIAFVERNHANAERDRALSGEFAANAISSLTADPEESVRLALRSAELDPAQGEEALRRALAASRFRSLLRGHQGLVTSAAFSPDGALVVTAGDDGTARVWNAATGRTLQVLRGGPGPVERAVFAPDGTRVLTIGAAGTVRLWRVGSGPALLRTDAGAGGVAAFSPDGRLLVTGGRDGTRASGTPGVECSPRFSAERGCRHCGGLQPGARARCHGERPRDGKRLERGGRSAGLRPPRSHRPHYRR